MRGNRAALRLDTFFGDRGEQGPRALWVQGTPEHSVSAIVRTVKSVSSRRIFAEHPEVKKTLFGGEFWSKGYFAGTVGKYTNENVIRNYVRNQGRQDEYKQLYLALT